jgi:hypothetical protein
MRRFAFAMLFGLLTSLIWTDGSAGGILFRRCRPCPCPCPCPQVAPLASAPVAAETREPFTSPKGRSYTLVYTTERGEREDRPARAITFEAAGAGDDFNGTDRAAAKTSISSRPAEQFATVDHLLDGLASDQAMRQHQPPISEDPSSTRVMEEDRNVTVTAWIFALKKEGDNDFHLIIGGNPQGGTIRYITAEVSGLPDDPATRARLSVPRQALKDFLQEKHKTIGGNYARIVPPVPVTVAGSLLFDIHHTIGEVGVRSSPQRIPESVWEIHPVTSIVFEP